MEEDDSIMIKLQVELE
jgi:hypothetical protein